MEEASIARGKKIELSFNDKKVICELRDTLPPKAKITNGAGNRFEPGRSQRARPEAAVYATECRLALGD